MDYATISTNIGAHEQNVILKKVVDKELLSYTL